MKALLSEAAIKKYGKIYITGFWLFATLVQFSLYGLFSQLEAEKYIEEAYYLAQHGRFSASRFIFYLPTILLIYISLKIKTGLYGAFFLQALYNLMTILLFYKALTNYFRNCFYSFATALLLIAFFPYSSWTVYLYTESFFYSSILLLLSSLLNYNTGKTAGNIVSIIFSLIAVIVSRPLGILFIFPVLFYFFLQAEKKGRLFLLPVFALLLMAIISISNIIFSTTANVTSTLAASQGCVVCGIIPPHTAQLKLTAEGTPLYQLYYYVSNNFGHFAQLGIIKLRYFYFMTRGYYSTFHNTGLLIFIIPVYFLSIVYIFSKKQKVSLPFFAFQVSSILFFTVAIVLQCDDYHNRFILSLYPVFLLMAAKGFEALRNRYSK